MIRLLITDGPRYRGWMVIEDQGDNEVILNGGLIPCRNNKVDKVGMKRIGVIFGKYKIDQVVIEKDSDIDYKETTFDTCILTLCYSYGSKIINFPTYKYREHYDYPYHTLPDNAMYQIARNLTPSLVNNVITRKNCKVVRCVLMNNIINKEVY